MVCNGFLAGLQLVLRPKLSVVIEVKINRRRVKCAFSALSKIWSDHFGNQSIKFLYKTLILFNQSALMSRL